MNRRSEFLAESLKSWKKAISEVIGPISPTSVTWHGLDQIRTILHPFMGANQNHGHYPTGGGLDFHSVEHATESGCLSISTGGSVDIFKPRAVTLEYFVDDPQESFLLLELDQLAPSGLTNITRTNEKKFLNIHQEPIWTVICGSVVICAMTNTAARCRCLRTVVQRRAGSVVRF